MMATQQSVTAIATMAMLFIHTLIHLQVTYFLFHDTTFDLVLVLLAAPKIWNSLPPHILQSQTLSSCRHHLKTHYFQSAYHAP